MNSRTFALLLAVDRARHDLTAVELAAKVAVDCSVMENFESGGCLPTPEVLLALADELGWKQAEIAPLLEEVRASDRSERTGTVRPNPFDRSRIGRR